MRYLNIQSQSSLTHVTFVTSNRQRRIADILAAYEEK